MRAMSVMRFVVFGAVGFGVSGIIVGALWHLAFLFSFQAAGLLFVLSGAVGGASLGLALKDFRQTVILALHGTGGVILGVPIGVSLGSFFNYSEVAIAAFMGAIVGALLGVAFGDWRTILALAVAGAVGFGVGLLAGDFLRASLPILRQVGEVGNIAAAGSVGGASLGAALGYLEKRKLNEERGPRVR